MVHRGNRLGFASGVASEVASDPLKNASQSYFHVHVLVLEHFFIS